MHAINATGLTKRFNGVRAVDGIDLAVDDGDVVGLLGPNGAGKTTTIMMLLGITTPDAGEVRILGHRLPDERAVAIAQTNFWASYLGLPGRLTVAELLEVHADLYGAPHDRIDEVVERFGISHLLKRFPSKMSSGQKTLVGLARCMVNSPRLLVLDEPTASLDPDIAERIRRNLTELQRQDGFAMLITSHNMYDIERLCRRVVFIGAGRIVADGSPAELTAHYGTADLEATFLEIASQMNDEKEVLPL
jgi:ABC-2 type transport system ATP-binding protein